jgi:hypothetical protein
VNGRPYTSDDYKKLFELFPHRSSAEVARLMNRTVCSIQAAAHKAGIHKTAEYLASPAACRLRRGDRVGAAYRFKPGQIPANKGMRRPGYSKRHGRMQETTFKKGQVSRNTLPIGTVKMDSDGYLRRKIANGIGGFGNPRVWEYVHKKVWQDAHGPIPKGFRIWWKDGNHRNNVLENLEMVSGAEHMKRTTIHNLPESLKEVIRLNGKLKRRIRKASEKQNGGSAQSPVRNARSAAGSRQADGD